MSEVLDRTLANLHIQPYFMHALDGEFTPPSDVLGSKHLAGKLLIGTYLKGVQDEYRDGEIDRIELGGRLEPIRYRPSWAPHVESSLYLRSDNRVRSIHVASGLAVASANATLSVAVNLKGTHISVTSATPGGESYTLPFRTEDSFTRDFVTDAMQDFFERSQDI